jgi:hypothetical protein
MSYDDGYCFCFRESTLVSFLRSKQLLSSYSCIFPILYFSHLIPISFLYFYSFIPKNRLLAGTSFLMKRILCRLSPKTGFLQQVLNLPDYTDREHSPLRLKSCMPHASSANPTVDLKFYSKFYSRQGAYLNNYTNMLKKRFVSGRASERCWFRLTKLHCGYNKAQCISALTTNYHYKGECISALITKSWLQSYRAWCCCLVVGNSKPANILSRFLVWG